MRYAYFLFFFIAIGFMLSHCATSNPGPYPVGKEVAHAEGVDNPSGNETLINHLRKVPGVIVTGSGVTASIRIRGIKSILGSSEPLFLINGNQTTGGFAAVVQSINVFDIKSIKVIKDPAELGFYGVRGGNGVIDIILK